MKSSETKKIKLLIIDVDGTLTDGKIYMGENGEMFKAFDIKDGCGIKDILPKYGIIPVIITARKSKMLENRCRELNISELYQEERDKKNRLDEILKVYSGSSTVIDYSSIAYIGDDILDLQCMIPIKEGGGLVGCPADAVKNVRDVSDFISSKNGGDGAVRDFIEFIVSERNNDKNK